jgi:transcriptional regulator with XRE-family HTH domain
VVKRVLLGQFTEEVENSLLRKGIVDVAFVPHRLVGVEDVSMYLTAHAEAILTEAIEGAAKGRIWERRPIPFTQATLIYLAGIPIWDYDTFLTNRTMWRAVRDMAGINSTTIADRIGISPASISRYEKGTRNPPKALMQDLHAAYVELYEQALEAAELMLAIDSYADTLEPAKDVPVHDQPFKIDDFYEWIARDTDLEDFEISHIDHLAKVRAMLPFPAWREPTPENLWLQGYPNAPALQPA